jgi:DNA gyrase subunit B
MEEPRPDQPLRPGESEEAYGPKDIVILRGVDAIRRRPGMYIGDVANRGLHNLILGLVAQPVNHALDGTCRHISFHLRSDGTATVADDGPGLPVAKHPGSDISVLQLLMTDTPCYRPAGKFPVELGLGFAGLIVANALSESLTIEVGRDGFLWRQEYRRGVPLGEVKQVAKTRRTGTRITFRPDADIFSDPKFHFESIADRLRELACLVPTVTLTATNEHTGKELTLNEPQGVVKLLHRRGALHSPIRFRGELNSVIADIAIQYTAHDEEWIRSYANCVRTTSGTHETGFRAALTHVLNCRLASRSSKVRKTGEAIRAGLACVIAVLVPEPIFESALRTRLGNPELVGIVQRLVTHELNAFLDTNPGIEEIILDRIIHS